jgi:hypothetical protein
MGKTAIAVPAQMIVLATATMRQFTMLRPGPLYVGVAASSMRYIVYPILALMSSENQEVFRSCPGHYAGVSAIASYSLSLSPLRERYQAMPRAMVTPVTASPPNR